MSTELLSFAEKLFYIDPRPSSLSIEKVISNCVLLDILVQIILLGYILIDDFDCIEDNASVPYILDSSIPAKNDLDAYVSIVCGTQIRNDAYWYFIEKTIFLSFFLIIFYINKSFVGRINRYHAIIMREKIGRYISNIPVYKTTNYEKRWKIVTLVFLIYKIIASICLFILILAALLIVNLIDEVNGLIRFQGVPCGPKMDYVTDIDVKLTCHLEHEYLVHVFTILTNAIAVLVLILYIISCFSLVIYVLQFKKVKAKTQYLDKELITYERLPFDDEMKE